MSRASNEKPQLSLRLGKPARRRGKRGGPRAGAGRKPLPPGQRKGLPHVARPFHHTSHPVHATMRVVDGLPNLRRADLTQAIGRSLRKGKSRAGFRVVHFSIQPDHVHLIVEAAGRVTLAHGLCSVAVRIAVAVNTALGRKGQVIASRYHARPLSRPKEVRNAIVYVLANFKHHVAFAKGIDPCSSGRWFRGWTSPPPLTSDSPVADPRTWLLRAGWLRHGRISPRERPAS